MAKEVEAKEVTRAELEGYLWASLNRPRSQDTGGMNRSDAARLLHESISAREAVARGETSEG